MATRLNQTMRDEIVASVLKATDIPKQRTALLAEARDVAGAAARAQLPPGWDKVVAAAAHKEWFNHQTSIYCGYHDHVFSVLNQSPYISFESFPAPQHGSFSLDVTPVLKALQRLTDRARMLVDKETELTEQLRGYLLSCRTVEAAVKGMPELAAHVPASVSTGTALVVQTSNLLSGLMAAGFKTT